MKKKLLVISVLVLVTLFTVAVAYNQRGYFVIGGEWLTGLVLYSGYFLITDVKASFKEEL